VAVLYNLPASMSAVREKLSLAGSNKSGCWLKPVKSTLPSINLLAWQVLCTERMGAGVSEKLCELVSNNSAVDAPPKPPATRTRPSVNMAAP